MQRLETEQPFRHPKHVMEYVDFKDHFYKAYGWGYPLVKISRSFEELWLNLRYGQWGRIGEAIRLRLQKWMGKKKHK